MLYFFCVLEVLTHLFVAAACFLINVTSMLKSFDIYGLRKREFKRENGEEGDKHLLVVLFVVLVFIVT